MTDTPDLRALAERYLDLWEQQFSAVAADPALASAMAAWLAPWRSMSASAPGSSQAKGDGPADIFRKAAAAAGFASANPAGGAAAAGAAPGDGGRGLDRIVERLDAIERRLAALERKPQRKPAAARQRKPGSPG